MPIYTFEAPDGSLVKIKRDSQPTDADIEKFLSNPADSKGSGVLERTGGIGRPLSREEAQNIASKRLISKNRMAGLTDLELTPEGNVRVIGAGPLEQAAALARGAARTSTIGLSEPILAAISPKKGMDVLEAASEKNPLTEKIGETLGMLSPGGIAIAGKMAGKALLAGASLGAKLLKAARGAGTAGALAGVYGGSEEAGKEIREGDVKPGKILSQAILSASDPRILALGGLAEAARLPKETSATRSATQVNESNQKLADILKPTGQVDKQNFLDSIESGDLHNTIRLIKSQAKPETLKQLIDAGEKTSKDLLQPAIEKIKKADPTATIDNQPLIAGAMEEAQKYPLGGEGAKIVEYVKKEFDKPISLEEAVNRQVQLNKEYRDTIKTEGIPDPAKEFVRRNLSDMISDEFERITGSKDNAYREWGKVEELNNMALKRFANLATEQMGLKGKGWYARFKEGVSHPSRHGVLKGAMESFYTGDLERINQQVKELFDRPDITPRTIAIEPTESPEPTSRFSIKKRSSIEAPE